MIRIVAVGKLKNKSLAALAEDYLKRCGGMVPCEVVTIKDTGPAREGHEMLRKLGSPAGNELVIALDERGEKVTSHQLADLLGRYGKIAFLIGGADGLGPAARQRAARTVRLSALTLTHEMAQVLLLEQIYRGLCILRNRPYHRD
jgi:23S rRNA (pseudouridine1915-N3)-methyltransferase